MSTSSATGSTGPSLPSATPAPAPASRPSSTPIPRLSSFDPVSYPSASDYRSPGIPLGTISGPSFWEKVKDCFAGIANCFRRRPSPELLRTMSEVANQENGSPRVFSSRDVTSLSAAEDLGFPSATPILISDKSSKGNSTIITGDLKVAASPSKSSGPSLVSRIASAFSRCFSGFFKEIQKDPAEFAQPEEAAFVPSQLKELREADSKAVSEKQAAALKKKQEIEPKRKEVNDYFHFEVENSCKKIAEAFNEFENLAPGVGSSDAFKKFLRLLKAEHKSLVKSLENAETVEEFCASVSKLEDALVRNINSKGSTLSANARNAFRDYLGDANYAPTVIDSLVSPSSTEKTGLETDKGMIAVHLLRREFLKKKNEIEESFPRLMLGSFTAILNAVDVPKALISFVKMMSDLDKKVDPLLKNADAPTLFQKMSAARQDGFKEAVKKLFLDYLKNYNNTSDSINLSIIKLLQQDENVSVFPASEFKKFYQEVKDDAEVQSAILRFFLEKEQAGKLSDVSGAMSSIDHMIKDPSAISSAVRKAQEERVTDQLQKAQAAAEKEKKIEALKQENFIKELKAKEGTILKGFEARLTEIRERAGQFEVEFGHPIPRLFEEVKGLNNRLIAAGAQSIQYDHIDAKTKQLEKRQGTIQEAHEHYNQIRQGLLGDKGDELDQELLDLVTQCEGDFERAFSANIALTKELAANLSAKAAEYTAMRKEALSYIQQLKRDAVVLDFDLRQAAKPNGVRLRDSVRALDSYRRLLINESIDGQTCGVNKAIEQAEGIGVVGRSPSFRVAEPDFLDIPDADPTFDEMSVKRKRVRKGSTYEYKKPLKQVQVNGRSSPSIAFEPEDGRDARLESNSAEEDQLP